MMRLNQEDAIESRVAGDAKSFAVSDLLTAAIWTDLLVPDRILTVRKKTACQGGFFVYPSQSAA
jgi:hypothetical protein